MPRVRVRVRVRARVRARVRVGSLLHRPYIIIIVIVTSRAEQLYNDLLLRLPLLLLLTLVIPSGGEYG